MKVNLERAIDLLRHGQVVAIPTETVYGLAAWLPKEEAISKIFSLKGRPSHNPLILHIGHKEECAKFASTIPRGAYDLMEAFWPGPLTIVLPIKEEAIPTVARANLPTAAFRMPKQAMALKLLQEVSPLVAPSANVSGSPSATRPEHVENDFGSHFPILTGGSCQHGLESTIVLHRSDRWYIARLGALSQESLSLVLGYHPEILAPSAESPICPGQLLAHYAPKARLVLSDIPFQTCPNRLPHVVGFGDRNYPGAVRVFELGKTLDVSAVAHRLYDVLRALDIENIEKAWVDLSIPHDGLWRTIRERLSRAASQ